MWAEIRMSIERVLARGTLVDNRRQNHRYFPRWCQSATTVLCESPLLDSMLSSRASRVVRAIPSAIGRRSLSSPSPSASELHAPREFKVVLDNETLYIGEPLAHALGWTPEKSAEGLKLRLSGWSPHYFTVTRAGTDSGTLALFGCAKGNNTSLCRPFGSCNR